MSLNSRLNNVLITRAEFCIYKCKFTGKKWNSLVFQTGSHQHIDSICFSINPKESLILWLLLSKHLQAHSCWIVF